LPSKALREHVTCLIYKYSNIGDKIVKYSFFVIAIVALFLVGCGEPKPGQYPPSQDILKDRDSANKE